MMQQQTFRVSKSNTVLVKAIFVFLSSVLALTVIYSSIMAKMDKTSIMFGIGLLCLLFVDWRISKRLPCMAVTLDNEGIWYTHLGRNHIVQWSQFARIKTKGNHLYLCDDNHSVKFKVNYPLENFDKLQDMIAEKIYTDIQSTSQTFAKTFHHQLIYIGSIAACLGIAITGDWVITLIMLFIIGVFAFEYLTTVNTVTLADKHFVLGFPLREKVVPFTEITDIKTTTRRSQESRLFQIGIFVKGQKKPYYLTKLGIDDRELLMILRQAVKPRGE